MQTKRAKAFIPVYGGQSSGVKRASQGLFQVVGLLLGMSCAFEARAETGRYFPHPERIAYDSQSLRIEGKSVFIFSGAFHYFRCPKELWRDRFERIRQAGFNTVETYVPWNWHEREAPSGLSDFSKIDLSDLDEWLSMAEQYGLYVIVRPGPYICAEWDSGGFPQWLLPHKPDRPKRDELWLRSDDPVYLAWCRHWFEAVCPVISKHQFLKGQKGSHGVILVQIENEYDFVKPRIPDEVMLNQVRFLASLAIEKGIEVPLFTCLTGPVRGSNDPVVRRIFDACNFYPRWNVDSIQASIDLLRRQQPDAPLATTELQGGWFATISGPLSEDQDGLTGAQINNLTLFAIQNGESILNYYMLYGGSNPGDWEARTLTSSYDYNAPIRECGGIGDRYERVWALGHFLREHGERLALSKPVACEVQASDKDVAAVVREAPGGDRYVFVRTSQHQSPRVGSLHIRLKSASPTDLVVSSDLEAFGSRVLFIRAGAKGPDEGIWYPQQRPPFARPVVNASVVELTRGRMRFDPGPSAWRALSTGVDLASIGIYDSRFLFYKAGPVEGVPTNVAVEYPEGDSAVGFSGGRRLRLLSSSVGSSVFRIESGNGEPLTFLYENCGHDNGAKMADPRGILAAHCETGQWSAGNRALAWTLAGPSDGKPEGTDGQKVSLGDLKGQLLPEHTSRRFKAVFSVQERERHDDAFLLRIGHVAGRWTAACNGRDLTPKMTSASVYSVDVSAAISTGLNTIELSLSTDSSAGAMSSVMLDERPRGPTFPLLAVGSPSGWEKGWWSTALNDSDWESVPLNGTNPVATQDAGLVWYRVGFEVPKAPKGIWFPYRLRLVAQGNGFIFLNGHPLGRYWEGGAQKDTYLPECWINFGPAGRNVLTFCLRPLARGAAVERATIEAYPEFAEYR